MLLNKDAIFKAKDLKTKDVEVPEWGGFVRVRTMTGTERDNFEGAIFIGKGNDRRVNFENLRAKLISLTVIDEEGNPLFAAKDIAAIGRKSALALDRVFGVAQELNGLRQEDVEKMVGNSEGTQGDDSTIV
jgi:hypothetical protein